MLALTPDVARALADLARAAYPAEACGLLFGHGTVAEILVPMANQADRLHALDPVEYPRTARDFFAMNEAKVAREVREREAAGERWLAIAHSHVDCGAYFSAEDVRQAAPDGTPTWPDLFQVVVDCRAWGAVEARAFRWDARGAFLPVATFPL